MRARYYSPHLKRFINADPIRFEGGMNWYAYANGDPIMQMDPSGLASVKILYNSGNGYVEKILDDPDPKTLNSTINGLPNASVRAMQFNGHGNRQEMYFNGTSDGLWVSPDDGHIYTDTNGTRFSTLVAPKLENNACVNFAGCNTAHVLSSFWRGDNITKIASQEVPKAVFTGSVFYSLGNELSNPFNRDQGTGPIGSDHSEFVLGIVKSYQNGTRINGWGSGSNYWYDTAKSGVQMATRK
jgi:uncharacterized protein RhaS with RHS repeats